MTAQQAAPTVWAAWHPQHGFDVPFLFEGAATFVDLDAAAWHVRLLNAKAGTNNRTGWRAVKVQLVRVSA